MKFKYFLLLLLTTFIGNGQNSNPTFIKLNDSNTKLIKSESEILILNHKDSFILIDKGEKIKIDYPKYPSEKDPNYFKHRYRSSIFFISESYKKEKQYIVKWNCPLTIYIDTSIPKHIKKELELFINEISALNIPNFEISHTNQMKNANYLILNTGEQLATLNEKMLDKYTEEQIANQYKNNVNYFLSYNNSNNIYACRLKVNINSFENKDEVIHYLKKYLFGSFGRFSNMFWFPKGSLLKDYSLDDKVEISNSILKFDVDILTTHYSYEFPKNFDAEMFINYTKE